MDSFETVARGQRAVAVAPIVTEFVIEQTSAIVSKYTDLYKSGRLTPEAALAGFAAIAALDELMAGIRNSVARANRAETEELRRATRREESE